MHQAGFDARIAERPLDRPVIGSGHFDRGDGIPNTRATARASSRDR